MPQTYYATLNIPFDRVIFIIQNDNNFFKSNNPNYLTEIEIKEIINQAWRKQAHINHPDKGGDIALMKYINEAKECLISTEKRKKYNIVYMQQIIQQLDIKLPVTHYIGNQKYHIVNPELTGDGSFSNMFKSNILKNKVFDRFVITLEN